MSKPKKHKKIQTNAKTVLPVAARMQAQKAQQAQEPAKAIEEVSTAEEAMVATEEPIAQEEPVAETKSEVQKIIPNNDRTPAIEIKTRSELENIASSIKNSAKVELEKTAQNLIENAVNELDSTSSAWTEKAKKEANEIRRKALEEKEKSQEELSEFYRKINDRYTAFVDEQKVLYDSLLNKIEKEKAELLVMHENLAGVQADFEKDKADFDGERLYLQKLKARYQEYSESAVETLRLEKEHLEAVNEEQRKRIQDQNRILAELDSHSSDGEMSLLDQYEQAKKELDEANKELDNLRNLPTREEYMALEDEVERYRKQADELDAAKAMLLASKFRENAALVAMKELEGEKAHAAALKALNDEMQKKLNDIADLYNSNQSCKFKGLLEIDKSKETPIEYEEFSGTLQDLVEHVRNYGASNNCKTKLFYSQRDIRAFVASLAASEPASRLIILQGLSGTGKSSLPKLFRDALGIRWESISVQPSWRDNRELLGYDNDFTNQFKETEFTKAVYRASKRDEITFIVLDEVNLARIEYYFADFLSVLESRDDEWKIPLITSFSELNPTLRPASLNYDNGGANLLVTKNVWFIGTANNDDSTSMITDKVYDRAQVLDMDEKEPYFTCSGTIKPKRIARATLSRLFARAASQSEYKMTEADWKFVDDIDNDHLKKMDITFGYRMKTQLECFVPVYVACGGTRSEAIDYFLAHKILRKLDDKYEGYIKEYLEYLEVFLDDGDRKGQYKESLKKIKQIKERNFNDRG